MTYRNMRKHIGPLVVMAGLLIGCGSQQDGTLTINSPTFPEIMGRTDVTAELRIGNVVCPLTIDPVTTLVSGSCPDLPLGTQTYTLEYRHTLTGVIIARASGTLNITEGDDSTLSITSLDTIISDDGDCYTNLSEVLDGTDPLDPTSFPSGTVDFPSCSITLTIMKTGSQTGTVTSDDGLINCGSDCSEVYNGGNVVTLMAIPGGGAIFAGWSGDPDCSDGDGVVTMSSNKTCTATFNTTWPVTMIDGLLDDVGRHSSIAVDSIDNIHIGYYDQTNTDLKHITNAGGPWSTESADAPVTAQYISIDMDSNDDAHMSYFQSGLRHATNASGAWLTNPVDGGTLGEQTSLKLDSMDNIHIAYSIIMGGNAALWYTTKTLAGTWPLPPTTSVDSIGDVGRYSSMAIDSVIAGENIHISYYDATNGDLKYVTNAPSGTWGAPIIIDSTGNVGQYTSIAIDSADNIHISYYDDAINGDLKYATNASGSWLTSTIDSGGLDNVGWYTSIAIDSADNVHISYYDLTNQDLKYATNASGPWTRSTLDGATEAVGQYTSIAMDSTDKIHISYYDITNTALKYTASP